MKSSVWLAIMGVITRIRPFKTAHDSKGVAMGSLNLDAGSSAKLSGERELVFLANSGKQMDNGLTVDLSTLEAPLIDGSKKLVSQLTDDDKLALPLLIDHSWRIDRQAGTITKLTVDEDGLEAVAKLATVETGELVYQLAKDGALTNSFSISIDYFNKPDKDGVISNAQLVEISVVYKGADQRAALRSVNSHEGDNAMNNISDKISSKFDLTSDQADELEGVISDAVEQAIAKYIEKPEDDPSGTDVPPASDDPAPVTSSNSKKGNGMSFNRIVPPGSQPVGNVATFGHDRKTWLDSKDALVAFERDMRDTDNLGVKAFNDRWAKTVASKMGETASFGIGQDDVAKLIPTEAISIIEDALNTRGSGLWPLFNKTGLDTLTIGANSTDLSTDEGRAHGYAPSVYGSEKKEETITLIKRALNAEYTYKYIRLNKGDVRKTQRPGALVKYVLSELPNRIIQTIEKQAVLGSFDADMSHFRSILTDSKDSASDWAGNKFAKTQEHATDGVLLYDFVRAAAKVKASGPKVLVTKSETVAELLLSLDANGRSLLPLGNAGLAGVLGVSQIITPEWWYDTDDATALGVIFTPSNYDVVGDTSIEAFTNFALQTNTNEYLQELYAGGGLAKENSAAVIVKKV
nr:MAG: major capsid protein [Bacteriophage sp.]